MAYTIRNTAGQVVATVNDKEVNTQYSVNLVGRQLVSYGELIQNNFIRLLECGANSTEPTAPLKGQLWYDTINSSLKINTGDPTNHAFKSLQAINYGVPATVNGETYWNTSKKEYIIYTDEGNIVLGPTTNKNYRCWGQSTNANNPTFPIGDANYFSLNTNVFFKIYANAWVPSSPTITATWEIKGSACMYTSAGNPVVSITDPFSIETISMGDDDISQGLGVSVYKPSSDNNKINLSFSGYNNYDFITTIRVEMMINDGTSGNNYGGK